MNYLIEKMDKLVSNLNWLNTVIDWTVNKLIPHKEAFAACPPSGYTQCSVVKRAKCAPDYCDPSNCKITERWAHEHYYSNNGCQSYQGSCFTCDPITTITSCSPC